MKEYVPEHHPLIFDGAEIDEAAIFDCIVEPARTAVLVSQLEENIKTEMRQIRDELTVEINQAVGQVNVEMRAQLADMASTLKVIMQHVASDRPRAWTSDADRDDASLLAASDPQSLPEDPHESGDEKAD